MDNTDLQRSNYNKKTFTPESCRKIRIKVIFKKDDVQDARSAHCQLHKRFSNPSCKSDSTHDLINVNHPTRVILDARTRQWTT